MVTFKGFVLKRILNDFENKIKYSEKLFEEKKRLIKRKKGIKKFLKSKEIPFISEVESAINKFETKETKLIRYIEQNLDDQRLITDMIQLFHLIKDIKPYIQQNKELAQEQIRAIDSVNYKNLNEALDKETELYNTVNNLISEYNQRYEIDMLNELPSDKLLKEEGVIIKSRSPFSKILAIASSILILCLISLTITAKAKAKQVYEHELSAYKYVMTYDVGSHKGKMVTRKFDGKNLTYFAFNDINKGLSEAKKYNEEFERKVFAISKNPNFNPKNEGKVSPPPNYTPTIPITSKLFIAYIVHELYPEIYKNNESKSVNVAQRQLLTEDAISTYIHLWYAKAQMICKKYKIPATHENISQIFNDIIEIIYSNPKNAKIIPYEEATKLRKIGREELKSKNSPNWRAVNTAFEIASR